MGMSASQARFLGLTARKSNVEYEGQQINQQRTALGNQTANYYNQMLGMSVPVPPAIDDFTKTIYTFSDGALKNSVTSLIARNNGLCSVSYLREWQDDFSTVAGTSHLVTRLNTQPSLQYDSWTGTGLAGEAISGTGGLPGRIADWEARRPDPNDPAYMNLVDDECEMTSEGQALYSSYRVTTNQCRAVASGYGWFFQPWNGQPTTPYNQLANPSCYHHILGALLAPNNTSSFTTSANTTFVNSGAASWFWGTSSFNSLRENMMAKDSAGRYIWKMPENPTENLSSITTEQGKLLYSSYEMDLVNGVATYKVDEFGDKITKSVYQAVIDFYEICRDFIATNPGYVDMADPNAIIKAGSYGIAWATMSKSLNSELPTTYNVNTASNGSGTQYSGDFPPVCDDTVEDVTIMGFLNTFENSIKNSYRIPRFNQTLFDKDMQIWSRTYTQLLAQQYEGKYMVGKDYLRVAGIDPTQEQINNDDYLKTLSAQQLEKLVAQEQMYLAMLKEKYGDDDYLCRYVQNTTTGEWIPQFYKLKDLNDAVYDNDTDISHSYIQFYTIGSEKKVEEIKNVEARLEQDATGRLINITLNPGTPEQVTHALTTTTVADQQRYDDAINQYEYDKYQYDQAINEINAKIQIIQTQDKNLELRLKQLDTEQNAIQTEMDAVSKVIQKNVESTFKTFG
jgi:hypothetical protein